VRWPAAVIWKRRESLIGAGDLCGVGVPERPDCPRVLDVAADSAAAWVITKSNPNTWSLLRRRGAAHKNSRLCMGSDLTWLTVHRTCPPHCATNHPPYPIRLGVLDGTVAPSPTLRRLVGAPVESTDVRHAALASLQIARRLATITSDTRFLHRGAPPAVVDGVRCTSPVCMQSESAPPRSAPFSW